MNHPNVYINLPNTFTTLYSPTFYHTYAILYNQFSLKLLSLSTKTQTHIRQPKFCIFHDFIEIIFIRISYLAFKDVEKFMSRGKILALTYISSFMFL